MNKVVLLAPTPPPAGGIAGWTMRMLSAQLKNGWMVDVVDEKLIGNTETFGEGSNRHLSDEIVRTFRIWRDLSKKLKDKNVKVVHSCIPSTTFAMLREYVCCLITHLHRRSFIIHFRCTTSNTTTSRIGILVLKRLCRASDLIFVLNNHSQQQIEHFCSTPIELIPNFVDSEEIMNDKYISKNVHTALYVGGVIEEKGCSLICDLSKSFPDIQFRMVGQAEQIIIDKAKDCPNVVITGPQKKNEVKEELLNADLFLFLSHFPREGFSNALAEAMAYGLPCIVTDWAANADMIEKSGGRVVPINDLEKCISAFKDELNYELRRYQSEFNIRKVNRCYKDSVILDQYVDCYERLCK